MEFYIIYYLVHFINNLFQMCKKITPKWCYLMIPYRQDTTGTIRVGEINIDVIVSIPHR